ncbi:hypothetical protein QFZ68_007284 [Streptomyces sp. V1I6]|nr:hypothetical protein [Streptomyces sp. V1I6]
MFGPPTRFFCARACCGSGRSRQSLRTGFSAARAAAAPTAASATQGKLASCGCWSQTGVAGGGGAYGSVTSVSVVGEPFRAEDGDSPAGEADQVLVGEVAQHLGGLAGGSGQGGGQAEGRNFLSASSVWQCCPLGNIYAVVIYSTQVVRGTTLMHRLRPVANGLRTDHPVPDLPFVDDSHIPLEDPAATEAIGRHEEGSTWGRWDKDRTTKGAWLAFTTDPIRNDLAWVVRYHPEHGRSVLLVHDRDASPWHTNWWGPQLLFRTGGYWWDGTTWYRPDQVWDPASEKYDPRPVKAAITITADHLLDDNAHPAGGRLLKVANFDPDTAAPDSWNDHLALWAAHRPKDARPLTACVVKFTAPELAADQLVAVPEMAQIGGIAASTLRAYISRRESDVPPPQATINGRNLWARPVAEDWAEQRRRSPEAVAATLAADEDDSLSLGATSIRERFTRTFLSVLWERPDRRKRWALRYRTEAAVHQVADELAFNVATGIDEIIDPYDLAATIRHAVLDEFATGQELDNSVSPGEPSVFYGITTPVARMLDWLIRHHPGAAQHTIGEIIGEGERRLNIPRDVSAESLRTALSLDGKLERQRLHAFLHSVLPPTTAR